MQNLFKFRNLKSPQEHLKDSDVYLYEDAKKILKDNDASSTPGINLVVAFDGETQRRFSSVEIMLYYDRTLSPFYGPEYWAIQQLSPITTEGFGEHTPHVPQNDTTLPQLTVAFKINLGRYLNIALGASSEIDQLCRRTSKSLRVLFESKHVITPDTSSVSVTLKHSVRLVAYNDGSDYPCLHRTSIRTARVIPINSDIRRKTICHLPTELLLKVFGAFDSLIGGVGCSPYKWQHDLLSCAQVCRQWASLSLKVLFARVRCSSSKLPKALDILAFANSVGKTPALGTIVQHLDYDYCHGWLACSCSIRHRRRLGYIQALDAILRATVNLEHLRISLRYSTKVTALLSAAPSLHRLHTLSITRPTDPGRYFCCPGCVSRDKGLKSSVSSIQLAHCLARWSTLTSMTVEYLQSGNIGIKRRFLRPPTCALTELCMRNSTISDGDLLYLTASSASTLARVKLDRVRGITNDGLRAFLDTISQNVTSLTIQDDDELESSPLRASDSELALDAVVDKMQRLDALHICGNIASEQMLRRRSEVFSRRCGSDVPVVRLFAEFAPRILECKDQEWAGWEVIGIF